MLTIKFDSNYNVYHIYLNNQPYIKYISTYAKASILKTQHSKYYTK